MTARWSLWLAVIGAVVCGYGVLTSKVGRAADRTGPTWQMWAAKPGQAWAPVRGRNGEVWNFASGSACSVDITSVARGLPDGSLVACRRFDVKAVTR